MYPYNLHVNPLPTSTTPSMKIANILGCTRHRESLNSIKNCIHDLYIKSIDNSSSKDELFKIITVIQDIGSGKTHLSLHLKILQEVSDKAIISYIDLSQVHPREIDNVFSAIMKGFDDEYFKEIF